MYRPATPHSARPAPRRRQGGFSFIEILIVMGIISVLVGGVVVAIGMWAEKGPQFQTKNTLTKVKVLVENWKTWSSFDVPGDVTKIPGLVGAGEAVASPENRINEGIESVYQALYWPGFKGDPAWDEETELSNADEDKLRKAVNKLGTTDLMEIKDGWGNPLIYFHNADYKKFSGTGQTYSSQLLGEVEARPWQREDGTFYNPLGFQIYSMGPDGEPNTEDDVTTWTKGD
jgi:prepilin-type N-terminal cleavage/methylation domain-containing protein